MRLLFLLFVVLCVAVRPSFSTSSSSSPSAIDAVYHGLSQSLLHSNDVSSLLSKRAAEMKLLMKANPTEAIVHADALRSIVTPALSSSPHIETPFNDYADIELLCPTMGDSSFSSCFHTLRLHSNRKTFAIFLDDDHPNAMGTPQHGVHVEGYYLDDDAVIRRSPLGASPHAKKTLACSTNIYGRTGQKKLLFIRVDFPDKTGDPISVDNALILAKNIDAYYRDASFNLTWVDSSASWITKTFRMPKASNEYTAGTGYSQLKADAESAAVSAGFVLCEYEMEVIGFSRIGYEWAGLGSVGGKPAWINGYFDLRVTGHELGHNYGLPHASFWRTLSTEPLEPSGTSLEYGDSFDIMGGQGSSKGHVNILYKSKLGWVNSNAVKNIPTTDKIGGDFILGPMDVKGYGGASLAGVSIQRTDSIPAGYAFWLSTRSLFPNSVGQLNIHTEFKKYTIPGSYLLDMHGNTTTLDDAGLFAGESFSDCPQNIHITHAGVQPCPANTALVCVNAVVRKTTSNTTNALKIFVTPDPKTVSASAGETISFTAYTDAKYFGWQSGNRKTAGTLFNLTIPANQGAGYIKVNAFAADGFGRQSKYVFAIKVGQSAPPPPDTTNEGFRFSCATGRLKGFVAEPPAPPPTDGTTQPPSTQPPAYGWIVGPFGACSKTCEGGVATRTVECKNAQGAVVADNLCTATKPDSQLPCNTQKCTVYDWYAGSYGACSKDCDGGSRVRDVECRIASSENPSDVVGSKVDDNMCIPENKPASMEACNMQPCILYSWVADAFSVCDKTCDGGSQTRNVRCVSQSTTSLPIDTPFSFINKKSGASVTVEGDSTAIGAKVIVSTTAGASSMWTLVSSSFGGYYYIVGSKSQKALEVALGSLADNAAVSLQAKYSISHELFTFIDQGNNYTKIAVKHSGKVFDVDANGFIVQNTPTNSESQLFAFKRQDGQSSQGAVTVADNLCTDMKPATQQSCNTQKCGIFQWTVTPFGACSATCGGGTQTRTVSCSDNQGKKVDEAQCTAVQQKPLSVQPCNTAPCGDGCSGVACNAPYGKCQVENGKGVCKCVAGVIGADCSQLPSITDATLVIPDGSNGVNPGDKYTITWKSVGNSIRFVNILLYHPNGIAPGYIARKISNTGRYDWLINTDHIEGPHFIEVSAVGIDPKIPKSNERDQSPTFTIVDPCKVIAINCMRGTCSLGSCKCEKGWIGQICDTPALCANKDCSNNGKCNEQGQCVCNAGFSGPNCEKKDGCNLQCTNGAPNVNCTQCICPASSFFTPVSQCSTCSLSCNNHGTPASNCSVCICSPGYAGNQCQWKTTQFTIRIFKSNGNITQEMGNAFMKLVADDLQAVFQSTSAAMITVFPLSLTPSPSNPSILLLAFEVREFVGSDDGGVVKARDILQAAFSDTESDFFSGESSSLIDTASLAEIGSVNQDKEGDIVQGSGNNMILIFALSAGGGVVVALIIAGIVIHSKRMKAKSNVARMENEDRV